MNHPPYVPASGLHDMAPDHLSQELATFCGAHALPLISAGELLAEPDLTAYQRDWLTRFIAAWDQVNP